MKRKLFFEIKPANNVAEKVTINKDEISHIEIHKDYIMIYMKNNPKLPDFSYELNVSYQGYLRDELTDFEVDIRMI